MGGEEVATDTVYMPPRIELTRFGEYCQRRGINPNLIMLKITLFVMYGGFTLEDLSVILDSVKVSHEIRKITAFEVITTTIGDANLRRDATCKWCSLFAAFLFNFSANPFMSAEVR
uniref:Uncharacterized protein n=1 Tax=Glossina austeni TaxID=7395 RepID=A0A1A9UH73_GLOAU